MRRTSAFLIISIFISASILTVPLSAYAVESSTNLMIVELSDDSPNYKLIGVRWYDTAYYYINPSNRYGFSVLQVVTTITDSAETWDDETTFEVFSYVGTTTRSAGRRDRYNVVSWGTYYSSRTIAVAYIWYRGSQIIESDIRMNTRYSWSLTGEPNKMDVRNIMTHEFGHWAGLADLYSSADYWLTMYGRAAYGETYKRDLGSGDILGLGAVYGP